MSLEFLKMIEMNGLTKKQATMLHIIWNCRDEGQFISWFSSLSSEDKCDAETLLQCLNYELLEQKMNTQYADAKKCLQQFTK